MSSSRNTFALLAVVAGCGKVDPAGPPSRLGHGGTAATAAASGAGGLAGTDTGAPPAGGTSRGTGGTRTIAVGDSNAGAGAENEGGSGDVCATATATATLEPVFLAFAFDVSGSMGKGDHPWHDATLKWDPVVAATRGFFEDPRSSGLSASLTAFPVDAGEDERCDAKSYEAPDVPMQALPSSEFGAALDSIRAEDWRGGTPTLAVVQGVLANIDAYRVGHPGRYALVLVTDGYPQDCADDSIASVEDAVRAVAGDIPTYVIGVKNPPLTDADGMAAPDTVSNLAGVAEAGGTNDAYLIDTGDPASTTLAFEAAVDAIRGVSVACELEVPAPPDGRAFEKDHVEVSYRSGSTSTALRYDADCTASLGWHYDTLDAPTEVVLCPDACTAIQADAGAALAVRFTCQPVIELPR